MGKVIKIDFSSGKKNDENKFYMMIGLPCSGKSHYCKEKFYNSNTIVISTDEIRKEITGTYDFDKQSNKLIFDTAKNRINQSLLEGYNVVFDATNTNSTYRKRLLKVARNNNCKLEAVVFMTPIEVCIDRNLKRDIERRVPVEVIMGMASFIPSKVEDEGFDEIKYIR